MNLSGIIKCPVCGAGMYGNRKNAKKQCRQYVLLKDRLLAQIDALDILDRNYDLKYNDLQARLDSRYDNISDAEEEISICEEKLYNIQKDKITSDNIYKYLIMFEKIYDDLSDMEKKEFVV